MTTRKFLIVFFALMTIVLGGCSEKAQKATKPINEIVDQSPAISPTSQLAPPKKTTITTIHKPALKPVSKLPVSTTTSTTLLQRSAELETRIPSNDSEIIDPYCPDQCSPLTADNDQ